MSRWLSEKLGNYIVNCEQLLITISEGRVNLKHTISQRNAQAIQDLLVGIYFLVHSRTYIGFRMGTGCMGTGTVPHLVYLSYTAYLYHSVMGIDGYFLQFSAHFYGVPNALLLFTPCGNLAFPPQVIHCLIWAAFSYLRGTHSLSLTLMSQCLYYWCQWSPLLPSSSQSSWRSIYVQ